jgi:putative membrane protein
MSRSAAATLRGVPAWCLGLFGVVWVWSAIAPHHWMDWALENALTVVAVPLFAWSHRYRHYSNRAWVQATLFLVLHTVGSHYTYSEVPAGDWVRDAFGLARNHYDRLVHFAFGLLLLRPLREAIIPDPRPLPPLTLAYIGVSGVAAWSAVYELIEWFVARTADPSAGTAYLGTQGDEWDAQKDMALAIGGALLAAAWDLWADARGRAAGPVHTLVNGELE